MRLFFMAVFLGTTIELIDSVLTQLIKTDIFANYEIVLCKIALAVFLILIISFLTRWIVNFLDRKGYIPERIPLDLWCVAGAYYTLAILQISVRIIPEKMMLHVLFLITPVFLILIPFLIFLFAREGWLNGFSLLRLNSRALGVLLIIFGESGYLIFKYLVPGLVGIRNWLIGWREFIGLFIKIAPLFTLLFLLGLGVILIAGKYLSFDLANRLWSKFARFSYITINLAGVISILILAGITTYNTLSGIFISADREHVQDKPNVLIILIDALRADFLGYMNSKLPNITPHIDQLAEEGVVFENAYSPCCWTLPSVASLFTSVYPSEHGMDRFPVNELLSKENVTIAEIFKDNGYQTRGICANSLIDDLLLFDQGFYDFKNLCSRLGPLTSLIIYDRYANLISKYISFKYLPRTPTYPPGEKITDLALKDLAKIKDTPFFMYLHYMDPHSPYHLQDGFYPADLPENSDDFQRLVGSSWMVEKAVDSDQLRCYFTEVGYVDAEVGRLLKGLDGLGLKENTIVVFVADHGEAFWDHGILGHLNSLHEELVHIPLIIRWPGNLPAAQSRSELVSSMDIFPTMLDLCGLHYSGRIMGKPLFYKTGPANANRQLFIEFRLTTGQGIFGVITPDWHYMIHTESGDQELYNRPADPLQKNNLAGQVEAVRDSLKEVLVNQSEYLSGSVEMHTESKNRNINPELYERLKSLGYLK